MKGNDGERALSLFPIQNKKRKTKNLQPATSAAPPPSGRLPLRGDAATFNLQPVTCNPIPMLRILFINRMASMERGGGETFDLEIARHLAQLGHQVTFLSGIPLFGRARLPIGSRKSEVGSQTSDLRPPTSDLRSLTSVTLRAPMFPWFPWDRVKAGWRLRVAEFWLFEKLAARWAWNRRDEFDIIQVCELPTFVSTFKSKIENRKSKIIKGVGCRVSGEAEGARSAIGNRQSAFPPVVLRLTAPNIYDPSGGIQRADAVIASGTSIAKIRKSVRPDCYDIPNAVDTGRFQVSGCRLPRRRVAASGHLATESPTWQVEAATTNEERRTKNEKQKTTNEKRRTLLYVARFQAFKNHDLLVRAFARVLREEPYTRLVLAGSGPLLGDVKRLVSSLGLSAMNHPPRPDALCDRDTPPEERKKRDGSIPSLEGNEGWVAGLSKQVVFLGEVPFADLPSVYAAADIKVISSEYESFCFAALEAMAAGLPIISTDCGWVPGLIGDSLPPIEKQWVDCEPDPGGRFNADMDGERMREVPGGLIVGRTEPDSMAKAVLALLRDDGMRSRMGAWNREKAVREHGWETSARKLEALYEELRVASATELLNAAGRSRRLNHSRPTKTVL